MKIRCGSHQQNRSIVRPGLSLMATKVALTAEEFRENSQRSIDLFNTEKLSTDSTRVLKSVYCNSVHFCRCNLRGACGGKEERVSHERTPLAVAICAERVEAKATSERSMTPPAELQSARSVWRQRIAMCAFICRWMCCNLRGACGGKAIQIRDAAVLSGCNLRGACGGKVISGEVFHVSLHRCNLRGACGGKGPGAAGASSGGGVAICAERVEAKPEQTVTDALNTALQSARSVWRQRRAISSASRAASVAICAERVEAKVERCYNIARRISLQSARSVWRQRYRAEKCAG